MIEVIEINAAARQVAKLLDGRGGFYVGEDGGLRFKGEWDEPGESMRLVLQLAEQAQMLHPLLERLDMTVEHGARAAAPHLVPDAMHIEPFFRALFPRQISSRTSASKISAPPPVRAPRPASRKIASVSGMESLKTRCARWRTSIAVKALMIKLGSSARSRCSNSIYQSFFSVGCNPPTMWTSVIPAASDSCTAATMSSIERSNACASRFLAAKAQN